MFNTLFRERSVWSVQLLSLNTLNQAELVEKKDMRGKTKDTTRSIFYLACLLFLYHREIAMMTPFDTKNGHLVPSRNSSSPITLLATWSRNQIGWRPAEYDLCWLMPQRWSWWFFKVYKSHRRNTESSSISFDTRKRFVPWQLHWILNLNFLRKSLFVFSLVKDIT